MALLKIAILLPSVWLLNASYTSPSSPPDASECVRGGAFYERVCPAAFPILHRLSASIPCLAESVVILATHYPSKFSSKVLARLVLSGQLPTSRVNLYFFLGACLATLGGLGRLWCFRSLGRHFTHQLAVRKDHQLITNGPYAIVRHPSYVFGQLGALGMSFMIGSPGSFTRRCGWLDTTFGRVVIGVWVMQNVLGWVLSFARARTEDALLRKHFGEEWERFARRVRYRLIPGVY